MPLFIWEDRYSVGVTEIDEHHRHLVSLLNKTYQDFLHHASPHELSMLFHELIDYATYHFSFEEGKMRATQYPEMTAHKGEHDEFIRRVVEMHTRYQHREKILFLEILSFLQNWLSHHILEVDAELGRFLTAVPSKPADKGECI